MYEHIPEPSIEPPDNSQRQTVERNWDLEIDAHLDREWERRLEEDTPRGTDTDGTEGKVEL